MFHHHPTILRLRDSGRVSRVDLRKSIRNTLGNSTWVLRDSCVRLNDSRSNGLVRSEVLQEDHGKDSIAK